MCTYVMKDLTLEMSDSNIADVADAEFGSVCDHQTKLLAHVYIHAGWCEYNVCYM